MDLPQLESIGKLLSQGMGIYFINDLLITGIGYNCIVIFVNHITKSACWRACRETIHAPAFVPILFDNVTHLHVVSQAVILDHN